MLKSKADDPYHRDYMIANFQHLLTLVAQPDKKPSESPEALPSLVVEAMDYLDENFLQNVTLVEVAEKLHSSPNHLSHLFNKYTQSNLRSYIAVKRVEYSQTLLSEDKARKIIAVAIDAGFQDISSFNRAFLKVAGMTPSQYRKLNSP